jgi:small subunit ribosomal protein S1
MSTETTASLAIQPKQHFSAKVLKTTMAGALVDIGVGVPGVVHISQIRKDPVNKVEDVLKEGDTVDVWVRRVKNDRIELSMIQPLAHDWKDLKPETVVKGKVVRIEPYGAFVDFGAERPGMVHVSEMAHGYVKTPGELVKVGDEVEAVVLDVDRRKKQIRLSMKALTPEPERVEEAPQPERKPRAKHSKVPRHEAEKVESTPAEPEPTAFEHAWQEALERSNQKKSPKPSQTKAPSKEQAEIIDRTLEKRLPAGG